MRSAAAMKRPAKEISEEEKAGDDKAEDSEEKEEEDPEEKKEEKQDCILQALPPHQPPPPTLWASALQEIVSRPTSPQNTRCSTARLMTVVASRRRPSMETDSSSPMDLERIWERKGSGPGTTISGRILMGACSQGKPSRG